MAHQCCIRKCDYREECTVAFFCDECNEPIDVEEDYFEVENKRLCENCWDNYVDIHFRNTAHMEVD